MMISRFRIWTLFASLLLVGGVAQAQTIVQVQPGVATGTVNVTDAGTCSATSTGCVVLNLGGYSGVTVQQTGTCNSCTTQFEMTVDGTNWVAVSLFPPTTTVGVSSTTTTGVWSGSFNGSKFRVRLSGYSSGSFVVTVRSTLAIARENTAGNGISTLADGATPALDASLGNLYILSATGDRTIAVPTNPSVNKRIVIRHFASGGARTLSLNTGAGGFRFGSDVTTLTQTVSGKSDYIAVMWNEVDSFWDVVGYIKGF